MLRFRSRSQTSPYEQVWHLWNVVVPRRSITGRLLWGKVWRRRDDERWIYKKYIETMEAPGQRQAVRTLVPESKEQSPAL